MRATKKMTHLQFAAAKGITDCTAAHGTFGGRCLNCGYDPTPEPPRPMQAIRTKYHGPTNTRGSRVTATSGGGSARLQALLARPAHQRGAQRLLRVGVRPLRDRKA